MIRNNRGSSMIELLVISGALISTGVTAVMLFRASTRSDAESLATLALYETLGRLEHKLNENCLETLFKDDKSVPKELTRKERNGIGDLTVGQTFSTGAGAYTIKAVTLHHRRYLGRDTSLMEFIVKSQVSRGREIVERFPAMVRTEQLEAKACAGVNNEQILSFLPFFGTTGLLAQIPNTTEFMSQLSCQFLANVECANPVSAWGVTPAGAPIDPGGGTVVPMPPVVYGGSGRSSPKVTSYNSPFQSVLPPDDASLVASPLTTIIKGEPGPSTDLAVQPTQLNTSPEGGLLGGTTDH